MTSATPGELRLRALHLRPLGRHGDKLVSSGKRAVNKNRGLAGRSATRQGEFSGVAHPIALHVGQGCTARGQAGLKSPFDGMRSRSRAAARATASCEPGTPASLAGGSLGARRTCLGRARQTRGSALQKPQIPVVLSHAGSTGGVAVTGERPTVQTATAVLGRATPWEARQGSAERVGRDSLCALMDCLTSLYNIVVPSTIRIHGRNRPGSSRIARANMLKNLPNALLHGTRPKGHLDGDRLEEKTTGAWIVHHTHKLQHVTGGAAAEFEIIRGVRIRATLLLANHPP